ncbi:MAG: PhzF family phenazine biosynthesis protein [Vagococcus sp.]|uniref:PhzF family phenazine biosynthesis protein n=1 Tax=Vagococcus sp. TaxID=1933889 RepID=UPI002FC7A1C7
MEQVIVYVASAFSKNSAGGNKAGVCLSGDMLNPVQKMEIAAKLGYSETAFISKSTNEVADLMVEYFTSIEEVPMCGHATVATFTVLRELKMLTKNNYMIETKSGNLPIKITDDMIYMEQNKPQFFEKINADILRDCFDINALSDKYISEVVSTGLKDIMLPVKDLETLTKMKPNFEEISRISETYQTTGIHAFALENDRIVCRNFAPLYDIPEESATGTANCALASYLYKNNLMKRSIYTFEQGYSLNQPSEIQVTLEEHNEMIEKVTVGGSGFIVEKLELFV